MGVVQAGCQAASEALARGERRVVDVRMPWEWDLVHVPGSVRLDGAVLDELKASPRDTPLAFLCHHGVRSHQAASWFVAELGFVDVWNVIGGIEAWAVEVDPTLERY